MSEEKDIVAFRMHQAFESVREAEILFSHCFYNSVVSHLYYAMFYAAMAATNKIGIVAKTHSGLKSIFHKEFVRSGLVSVQNGKLYDNLMNLRAEGDYGDFATFSEEEVASLFEEVATFLKDIETIVSGNKKE